MNHNFISNSRRNKSIADQRPQPYFYLNDDYPEYVQVQRTQGVISGNTVLFSANSFDPNLFLRSRAYIKISVSTQRSERDPANGDLTSANWHSSDVIYKKPGMVLANSMTSAKLRLNSTQLEYKDPRYWQQHITQQHCGRTITDKFLSTSGSSYPHHTGVMTENGVIQDNMPSDDGIQEGIDSAFRDIGTAAASIKTFQFTELLNIGCFNFMDDKKDQIYEKSWYKKMSPLIPYVRQIGLTLDFKDISANSLMFQYGRNVVGAGNNRNIVVRDISITSAELVLAWVKPRSQMIVNLPPTIKLQSWYVDHKKINMVADIGGGPLIQANDLFTINETFNIHQIPSYIHVWATINKDDPNSYDCRSVFCDSDGAGVGGTDPVISINANSQESRGQPITGLTIRVNVLGGDDILDANYNTPEMYRFTTKNSAKDFPWSQTKYDGAFPSRFASYPSMFSLIMGEDDLNSYFVRKGQTVRDFVISINGQMRANDGYGIDRTVMGLTGGGNKQWDLHVAFFYDRYYIELDNCSNGFAKFDSNFF